jgi:hypothetical protein
MNSKDIFDKASNSYLAYEEATKSLDWRTLNKQFYELLDNEDSGFEVAADRYASWFASIANN